MVDPAVQARETVAQALGNWGVPFSTADRDDLAGFILVAVEPLIRADERARVRRDIARQIEALRLGPAQTWLNYERVLALVEQRSEADHA